MSDKAFYFNNLFQLYTEGGKVVKLFTYVGVKCFKYNFYSKKESDFLFVNLK